MTRGITSPSSCGILLLLLLNVSFGFELGLIDRVRNREDTINRRGKDSEPIELSIKDMTIDFYWKSFHKSSPYNFSMLWDPSDVKIDSTLKPYGKLSGHHGNFSLSLQTQTTNVFNLQLSFKLFGEQYQYKFLIRAPPRALVSKATKCNNTQCNNNGVCDGTDTDFTCSCYHGWTGSTCATGCTSDAYCLHGTCNRTSGICSCDEEWGTRYGPVCDWGLHFDKKVVCPLEEIDFNWTIPLYEFQSLYDGMFIYYSKTENVTTVSNDPALFSTACLSDFHAYVWPWDKHWDHSYRLDPVDISMNMSSFNWTHADEGFLSFFMFPDFDCKNVVGAGVTVLSRTDPRCTNQTTEPNCKNGATPYQDVNNGRWGCNCTGSTFGNDCSLGCVLSESVTSYGGAIDDGSKQYRPLVNTFCQWVIEPSEPVTSMRIQFHELWILQNGQLTFDFLETNSSTNISIQWFGRPFGDYFRDLTIFTAGPVTVTFSTPGNNPVFGWDFEYIPTGCPPGNYINLTTYHCDPCPAGYYTSLSDQTYCLPCGVGTFQDNINSTSCKPCELNLYQNEQGQTHCKPCPAHTHTISKTTVAVNQCLCDQGYYAANQTIGVECIGCPEGANCSGGSYYVSNGEQKYVNNAPTASPRYWSSKENPYVFLKCATSIACPGGPPETCGFGFTYEMCSRCMEGYYNRLGKCNKCTGTSSAWLPLIVIVLLPLCAILYKMVNRKDFVRFATLLSISTAFGLLISFLQIIVVYQNFRIQWPEFITDIYAVVSILNFNIDLSAPECSVRDISDYEKYILKLFLPLVFPACFVVLHLLCYLQVAFVKAFGESFKARFPDFCRGLTQEEAERKRWTLQKTRRFFAGVFTIPQPMNVNFSINTLIMIFDLAYIYLCQSTFNIFNCYKNTDGTYSLFNDPETRCYQSQWFKYLPFTILSILFYVLSFPVLLSYVIYVAPMQQENKGFMQRYNQLFFRFQPSKYWWEAVIVARKFCITFVILIVSSDAVVQTTLSITFIVASLLLHIYNWPYWVNDCNWLEAGLLVVNLGILAIALLFIGEDPLSNFGYRQSTYNFYSGLVIFFIVVGFVGAIAVCIWSLFRFFRPVPKQLVSSEQEAVVGMWTSLTSKNSQADFDAVWKQLPREEQQMAIHSAEAFTYEALGQRGTKIRRVSPSRLRYAEELKRKQEARAMRVEEIGDSEYAEEDLIQLPSIDGSSSSGPTTQSSINTGVDSETSNSPKSATNFPSVVAESSRDGLLPKESHQKSSRKKKSRDERSRKSGRSKRKERRGRSKDRMDESGRDEKNERINPREEKEERAAKVAPEEVKSESLSSFEATSPPATKINVLINSRERSNVLNKPNKRNEEKESSKEDSSLDSSSSSSDSDSD